MESAVLTPMLQTMLEAEINLWSTTYFMLLQQTNAEFEVALGAADQALERFREAFDFDDVEEESNVSH